MVSRLLAVIFFMFLPLSAPMAEINLSAGTAYLSPSLQAVVLTLKESQALLDEAERNADHADRLTFDYATLVADLTIIRTGLVMAYSATPMTPHQPKSLAIEYGYVGKSTEAYYLELFKKELAMMVAEITQLQAQVIDVDEKHRRIEYLFMIADLNAVSDAITVALAGVGSTPRQFPAVRGAGSS